MSVLDLLFAPGFFASAPVQTALIIGSAAAIVSALIGVFTVLRGQSFAGHALSDISSAGGSVAFLLGISALWGFLGVAVLAAGALELAGLRRAKERDLVTGIVLGAGLGLTALLLHLDIGTRSSGGAAISVMFGSIFAIPASMVLSMLGVSAVAVLLIGLIYRPLLLTSLDPNLASAQGVRVHAVGLLHLLILSLAVTLSAMTIGAILSTALLIGPAAAAVQIARRPGRALILAVLFGLIATWGGVLLAYDSYAWTPGQAWPVSFFITSLAFLIYLGARLWKRLPIARRTAEA
ncbi:metal ABC transporter permease [Acidisoma cellulosilytica]|uniref:Metal ABC transporter permease n=1 Tax=Acidisoma cellulosilyticum TaxID=2802395 RepID=A0A963Z1C5_9PROT|nr:metal ABC transporter permease [Acidisoma cellulosilyticum]MCB8880719.1 metal ABC transporter permease [Acidisoma cellulosilyticum]